MTKQEREALKEAQRKLRSLRVRLTYNADVEEFRVSIGSEASAYYTNDLTDAVGTGTDMARRRDDRRTA